MGPGLAARFTCGLWPWSSSPWPWSSHAWATELVSSLPLSVSDFRSVARERVTVVFAASLLAALAAGAVLIISVQSEQPKLLLPALGVPVLVLCWRFSAQAVIGLAFAATLIEQTTLGFADRTTERIPLWKPLAQGLIGINPAELIMLTLLLAWVVRAITERRLVLPRSAVAVGVGLLLVMTVYAEALGLAVGGVFNITIVELRPWVYLAVVFFLAAQLVDRRSLIQALLWAIVLASGIKAVQGTVRYLSLGNVQPAPPSILSHDESLFFGSFILLTALLWVFGVKSRLRAIATSLLPVVVFANLANNRRTAWLIVVLGLAAVLAMAWVRIRERRRLVTVIGLAAVVIGFFYVQLGARSGTLLGRPAEAIQSQYKPSPREYESDLYRRIETADLGLAIRHSTPLGVGFGLPLATPIPLPVPATVFAQAPLLLYLPHNTILYQWWRFGLAGAVVFWWLIGAAIIAGGRLVRAGDRLAATLGALAICVLIAYVVYGWTDQGLSSYRVATYVGCVLGVMDSATRMFRSPQAPQPGP